MITRSQCSYDEELNDLLRRVAGRGAVLFLGSGFSADATGLNGEDMPIASVLADEIGKIGEFEAHKDLRYAADRYLDEKDPNLLIKLLRQTFTVKNVAPHHRDIANAPWRRVYTTNYDLCFERAALDQGKLITTVDVSAPPVAVASENNICVHLNGSLNNLSIESLNREFKLSTTSYLAPEAFTSSRWNYPFQRDLEFASAIVFVGYSMYDIEIQKILHQNDHYSKKTFFITRQSKDDRRNYTLSKYGKILPIETRGFGEALAAYAVNFEPEEPQLILASLWKYELGQEKIEARDSDVDAFLMRGEITDELIDSLGIDNKGAPILIPRADIIQASELLKAGSNIVITAEFGNGKSVFLRMLRSLLTHEAYSVYTADAKDFHQHEDLEKLIASEEKCFLMIDSYEQNLELIKHYAELAPVNIQLILGARVSTHERFRLQLSAFKLKVNELVIDELEPEEVDRFLSIIDNAGYWGDRAAMSPNAKRDFITYTHKRQLSLNLLGLLSAPQMVKRVKDLVEGLLASPQRRETVFAISLLSTIDLPLTSSLIAEIAMNNEIYSSDLRGDQNFNQIFNIRGSQITTKSSIFALSLISHQFSAPYIVDQLLKIVGMLGDTRGELKERKDIQKNLLRFSVIERLLPEKQRKSNLVRYYDQVKREVPWLQKDPHFWLQYGMTQLTYKDYDKAQTFFNQAYEFAALKHDYHTIPIDTQQARLYLLRSLEAQDSAAAYKYFMDAHQLIRQLPVDSHKYRQVDRYKDVYDQRYPKFSGRAKVYFEQACQLLIKEINEALKDWNGSLGRSYIPIKVRDMLENTLNEIKTGRTR